MTPRARLDSGSVTVRSNDPDSPVQTFRVAANGASLGPADEVNDEAATTPTPTRTGGVQDLEPPPGNEGCACASVGRGSLDVYAALGLGLALAGIVRRRRRS